jgi:hypothetical protein
LIHWVLEVRKSSAIAYGRLISVGVARGRFLQSPA